MLLVNFIARLISILRSAAKPGEVAAGFTVGMIAGLTPSLLVTIAIFLLLIILNVNLTSGLFAIALFKGIAFFVDPLFHDLGFKLLAQTPQLASFWTQLYNMPFVPLTRFNNTVVLGSFVTAIVMVIPSFFLVRHGIIVYRTKYDEKIMNLKVVKYLKTMKLFQTFTKLKNMGDKLW